MAQVAGCPARYQLRFFPKAKLICVIDFDKKYSSSHLIEIVYLGHPHIYFKSATLKYLEWKEQ